MRIAGTAKVRCPACDREHEAELVQSINTREDPESKRRLLAGELNVLACDCGRGRNPTTMQLAAKLVFYDPDADYFCQVVPAGDVAEAALAFRAAGATGTLRVVPTQNALVEKVKILDAGLEDWAIEMTKLLLLAATGGDLDRVLLFQHVDEAAIHWLRFDDDEPRQVASPVASYARLAARLESRPAHDELQIDRAWAVIAVQQLIASGN